MSHPPAPPLPYESNPVRPPRSAGAVASTVIAWCVVGLICLGLPLLRAERAGGPVAATQPTIGAPVKPSDGSDAKAADAAPPGQVSIQTRLGGRYAVGTARYFPQAGAAGAFVDLPANTVEDRIASAIVAGEVLGRDAALKRLRAIDTPDAVAFEPYYAPPATRPTTATTAAASPAALPAVSADLISRYGWFARLAESFGRPDRDPERAAALGEAQRTILTLILGAAGVVVAGVIGLALMVTAIVLVSTGKLRFTVGRPLGPAHVYIEAFAIYLAGVVVASLAVGLLLPSGGLAAEFVGLGAVVAVAAAWPFVRGVPWAALRQDWGLHAGRGVLLELGCGVCGYLAGLPVLAVGIAIMAGLVSMSHANPTHPIQQEALSGSISLIFVIASVFAPLTEEMLFRGALVSHLRGGMGVALSAIISGLVFAAVHPQGWAAIPALGSIGAVLALVRQWRGTLLASIAAHALNNTCVLAFFMLTTR